MLLIYCFLKENLPTSSTSRIVSIWNYWSFGWKSELSNFVTAGFFVRLPLFVASLASFKIFSITDQVEDEMGAIGMNTPKAIVGSSEDVPVRLDVVVRARRRGIPRGLIKVPCVSDDDVNRSIVIISDTSLIVHSTRSLISMNVTPEADVNIEFSKKRFISDLKVYSSLTVFR
eukprot:TRINITY_DN1450_c0_g2_i2.p1 TRINITY_DN1450_c0_g2~~TRINITY_DN1450_c0_g2_i2.p1  ORF type:complete len:173 (+),score=4.74 TRINITY_DN1450_c0_g2_i2:229-747(+)